MRGLFDELLDPRRDDGDRGGSPADATSATGQLASIDRRLRSMETLATKANRELGCIATVLCILTALVAFALLVGWFA